MICHQRLKMKYMWEGKSIKYQLQKALFFCDNFIVTIRKNNLNLGRLKYSLYAILFFTYCGSYRIYVLWMR